MIARAAFVEASWWAMLPTGGKSEGSIPAVAAR
jgi:hypothetical protein